MEAVTILIPAIDLPTTDKEFADDVRRIWEDWNGEHVIWILPENELQATTRWEQKRGDGAILRMVAIPGNYLNCMTTCRMDAKQNANGHVIGTDKASRSDNTGNIGDVHYAEWINAQHRFIADSSQISLSFPTLKDGFIELSNNGCRLTPRSTGIFRGDIFPVERKPDGTIELLDSPNGGEFNRQVELASLKPVSCGTTNHRNELFMGEGGRLHARGFVEFTRPFNNLFGASAKRHIWEGFQRLKLFADSNTRNYERCATALRNLNGLSFRAMASLADTVLRPGYGSFQAGQKKWAWEDRFGITRKNFSTIIDPKNSPHLHENVEQIECLIGSLGYFWFQQLADAKAGITTRKCAPCNTYYQVSHGNNVKFCNSPECKTAQARLRQRKRRLAQKEICGL